MGQQVIHMEGGSSSDDEEMDYDEANEGAEGEGMEEDVEMMYDRSAYHANQAFFLGWPCLSFDVLRDNLGGNRDQFPHTLYMVAGTQADQAKNNRIVVARIWDLRSFGGGKPAAHFKWHTSPITSVEWHPTEDSMPAVSEAKCATTAWDMSLEADDEAKLDDTTGQPEVPPALMFEHMGQKDVKEIHWHPQIPGMLITTASDGFNVFKPCNC